MGFQRGGLDFPIVLLLLLLLHGIARGKYSCLSPWDIRDTQDFAERNMKWSALVAAVVVVVGMA
jgi:hypothetical protein